jgi:hypothetical protein
VPSDEDELLELAEAFECMVIDNNEGSVTMTNCEMMNQVSRRTQITQQIVCTGVAAEARASTFLGAAAGARASTFLGEDGRTCRKEKREKK